MSFMNRTGNGTRKVALTAAIVLAASAVMSGRASAVNDLNAGWTFESPNFGPYPTGSGVVGATGPNALADGGTQAGTATVKAVHVSTGTTTTTPAGNGSAQSYSTNQWAVNDYYQIQTSTLGATNIGLQFEQTGSSTGPRDFKVQYSTNGTTFTDFANYQLTGATWASGGPISPPQLDTYSYSFGSVLDNLANVYIRLTQADNVSNNGGTVQVAGTGRIDNVGVYSNFDINQPPIVAPPTPPVLPIANDVVIGVNNSSAKATIGLARGTATANGGSAPGTFSGWQSNSFVQYLAFDNLGGTAHNVHGNLLGVDSGTTAATGGTIYNLATQGSLPFASSQSLATVAGDRLGQIAVSPNNAKVAVAGADTGQITFFNYTAGNSMGAGAALGSKLITTGTPLTPAITTSVTGTPVTTQQRQGVTWIDNNSVLSLSTSGNLYLTDATTLASTPKGSVTLTQPLVSASTSLEYNTAISPYVWALYGGFNGTQNSNLQNSVNTLYILDPANNYSVLHTVDLSSTSTTNGVSTPAGSVPTANSLAFDSAGDLFIGGNGGSVNVIPHAAANALTLADKSALPWYVGTFSNFTGIDIGLAAAVAPGVSGDYNGNGKVDAADYVLWKNGGPLLNDPTPGVQASDYDYWKSRFGATSGSGAGLGSSAVPEPASALLMLLGFAAFACKRRS
jgi:hypothetical protein